MFYSDTKTQKLPIQQSQTSSLQQELMQPLYTLHTRRKEASEVF